MEDKEIENYTDQYIKDIKQKIEFNGGVFTEFGNEFLNSHNYVSSKTINPDYQPKDIYKLIDQLIKEGKNQGYKISVTIE